MGIFSRQTKLYDPDKDDLPPVPENEIGEVQNLAELIWNFEDHGNTSWKEVRDMHERGYETASRMYKDRINLANHILERYQPRDEPRADSAP